MDIILLFEVVMIGIIEGIIEFLPISSTGHLILANYAFNFTNSNFLLKEKINMFEIVIQIGAIFAMFWEYRIRIFIFFKKIFINNKVKNLLINLFIASLPVLIFGFLFEEKIKILFFAPTPIAIAFILGGFIILWIEHFNKKNNKIYINTINDITKFNAFKIGCIQMLALIPGVSRSGATIIGGILFGLSRKTAIEFSFVLGIPTLCAATFYSIYQEKNYLVNTDIFLCTIGIVASFFSACFCIRSLLHYISTHSFAIFAWYRIFLGCIILFST